MGNSPPRFVISIIGTPCSKSGMLCPYLSYGDKGWVEGPQNPISKMLRQYKLSIPGIKEQIYIFDAAHNGALDDVELRKTVYYNSDMIIIVKNPKCGPLVEKWRYDVERIRPVDLPIGVVSWNIGDLSFRDACFKALTKSIYKLI